MVTNGKLPHQSLIKSIPTQFLSCVAVISQCPPIHYQIPIDIHDPDKHLAKHTPEFVVSHPTSVSVNRNTLVSNSRLTGKRLVLLPLLFLLVRLADRRVPLLFLMEGVSPVRQSQRSESRCGRRCHCGLGQPQERLTEGDPVISYQVRDALGLIKFSVNQIVYRLESH